MLNIIDIGTNSARLMKAKVEEGTIKDTKKFVITVRTGEKMTETGIIGDNAVTRICGALSEFKNRAEGTIECFATSAFRDAKNRETVIAEIYETTGIAVRIMSGDEEAEMGFTGVTGKNGSGTVVDIGGGSTEVIHGKNGAISYEHSFDIGCVRALDKFGENGGKAVVEAWAAEQLRAVPFSSFGKSTFYGIGGTVTTLAAIDLGLAIYDRKKVDGHAITIKTVGDICSMLYGKTIEERKSIPGLRPERADIIAFGASILAEYMRIAQIDELRVSESDNLEGYALLYCL